jgi:hypothetical protein
MRRTFIIHYQGEPVVAISLPDPMPMTPHAIVRAYAKQYDFSEITLSYSIVDTIPMPQEKK